MVEVVALTISTAVLSLFYVFQGYALVNAIAPIVHGAIMAAGIWQLIRRASGAIWTPLFAYRMGALLFFGIGSFVSLIADAFTREYELALYAYSDFEAAKVNLLWLLSSTLLIGGAWLTSFAVTAQPIQSSSGPDRTLPFGYLFFALGFGFLLFYELPASLGYIDVLLPGVAILLFQAMSSVGVFLIALWGFDRGGRGLVIIALLFLLHVILSLLLLNKSTMLFPQLLISLAYLMNRVSTARMVSVFVAGLASFSLLQPLVAYGRYLEANAQLEDSFTGRLSYVGEWVRGESSQVATTETANPLLRLSYLNAATYVVTRYDTNQPANTIEMALVAIIPRVIWRNKPRTTAINEELYYELTGNEGSSLGTTVAADTYWNFGWAGALLMLPLGLLAMVTSMRCYVIVAERRWVMFPFVLICWRTANAVDGQFVNAVFAPSVMAIVVFFFLQIGGSLLAGRTPNPAPAPQALGAGGLRARL